MAGVVALAALVGGCTTAGADTRGYKLAPPRSVGEYEKRSGDFRYVGKIDCAGQPSDADCYQGATEVIGIGISPRDANRIVRNASGTGAYYRSGPPEGAADTKWLAFRGLQGDIPEPDQAVDRFFRSIAKREQVPFRGIKLVRGTVEDFGIGGYDGAVMRCRKAKGTYNGAPEAVCVWADHSTVAAVNAPLSMSELADLTRQLYKTSRKKK
ncbi:hypothetical protein GCM10020367_54290 [Streptomyces sannanensis]|uniref:DUF3558 domain-containing protein n=2 Tax=Streptomyces sannanensis TaxID=285536 RepID=A0ABP6SIU8_9ACTN